MSAGHKTELNAFLAKGTNFKGELRFSGIVRIDGIFEGKVFTDGTLVVGETGVVKGEIYVGELLSSGVVEGTIRATRSMDIAGEGRLFGKVSSPSLNVAEGVVVEAQLRVGAADPELHPVRGSSVERSGPDVPHK